MKRIVFLVLMLSFLSEPLFAKRMNLSDEDVLRVIDGYSFILNSGEKVDLAYKLTRKSFIVGYSLSDDGYVLMPYTKKGILTNYYYHLSQKQLAILQKKKLLPIPLPKYKVSIADYILGHLLWLILFLVLSVILYRKLIKKQHKPLPLKRKRINKNAREVEVEPQIPQWTLTKKPPKNYKD